MGKNRDVKRRRKGDSTPVRTDEKDPFSRERERERERSGDFFFSTGIDSRRRIIRYRYRNPICKRHTQGLVTLIGDHAHRLTMVVGDTRWPADNGPPCTDADRIAGSVERIRGVMEHYFNAPASNRCDPTTLEHGCLSNRIFMPASSIKIFLLFSIDFSSLKIVYIHSCFYEDSSVILSNFYSPRKWNLLLNWLEIHEESCESGGAWSERRARARHPRSLRTPASCKYRASNEIHASLHACRVRGTHLACA